jgi:hypothetical protein
MTTSTTDVAAIVVRLKTDEAALPDLLDIPRSTRLFNEYCVRSGSLAETERPDLSPKVLPMSPE